MECIYIKVPVYVKLWLQYHYCDNTDGIIHLQRDMKEIQRILYEKLERNTFCTVRGGKACFCLSRQMYNLDHDTAPDEYRDFLPTRDKLKEYVGIAIEPEHYFHGRTIPCDQTAWLKYEHARFVHYYLTEAFFVAIEKWLHKWPELARRSGESPDMLNGVQTFLSEHDIPIEQDAAIIRVMYRGNRRSKSISKKS